MVLAPHGGRRQLARIPGEHKVNDLHTGAVARTLARLLGASLILNESVDRNELDLNRTMQVRRDAPWLIDTLAEMLHAKANVAERATVLVIHGWNVSQVACDVGIGMQETAAGLRPVRHGSSTVSASFVAERLRPLQHAAAAARIAVTIGSRYPAAHPNNLLQLFREGEEADAEGCPIAALCRTWPIDAVQLELAIPLRWPGPRREDFVRMLAAAFGAPRGAWQPRVVRGPDVRLRTVRGRAIGRRGLQFIAEEMLVMTSIEAGVEGPVGGRLVVSEDRSRLGLFTGELVPLTQAWSVPPLEWICEPDGSMRVVYDGPLVRFPNHTPFVDLENGLAGGRLVEARLDVVFEPMDDAGDAGVERFGHVRGELTVDGRRHRVATRGVAMLVDPTVRVPMVPGRIGLPGAAGGSMVLTMNTVETIPAAEGHQAALFGRRWTEAGFTTMHATATIALGSPSPTLLLQSRERDVVVSARLERLMPVLRPGPHRAVVETTYALVRVDDRAIGWLELSVSRSDAERITSG